MQAAAAYVGERGQQTQDEAVHGVDLWRFVGEYLAAALLSPCQAAAAVLRRRTGRDGNVLLEWEPAWKIRYTTSTNLMLRSVQQIGIIMPELHPPKKTLHFQTREYTQDLGCHTAV